MRGVARAAPSRGRRRLGAGQRQRPAARSLASAGCRPTPPVAVASVPLRRPRLRAPAASAHRGVRQRPDQAVGRPARAGRKAAGPAHRGCGTTAAPGRRALVGTQPRGHTALAVGIARGIARPGARGWGVAAFGEHLQAASAPGVRSTRLTCGANRSAARKRRFELGRVDDPGQLVGTGCARGEVQFSTRRIPSHVHVHHGRACVHRQAFPDLQCTQQPRGCRVQCIGPQVGLGRPLVASAGPRHRQAQARQRQRGGHRHHTATTDADVEGRHCRHCRDHPQAQSAHPDPAPPRLP
jgi:hypothetical protein